MLNTRRTSKSTARSGVVAQLVTAFSSCFDDDAAHNSDGGVISGLTLDVAGQNLLAVDNDAGVVKVFDPSGRFKHAFGKGVLVEPWDVFVTTSGELTHAFNSDDARPQLARAAPRRAPAFTRPRAARRCARP